MERKFLNIQRHNKKAIKSNSLVSVAIVMHLSFIRWIGIIKENFCNFSKPCNAHTQPKYFCPKVNYHSPTMVPQPMNFRRFLCVAISSYYLHLHLHLHNGANRLKTHKKSTKMYFSIKKVG